MKTLKSLLTFATLITFSTLGALQATAQIVDRPAVECRSLPLGENPRDVSLRIDRGFGSVFQDAVVRVGELATFHTVLLQHMTSWTEIRYWGNDFDLVINVFMENDIKYYTPYDAELTVTAINGGKSVLMRCEFLPF